jgi:hypothetical protein
VDVLRELSIFFLAAAVAHAGARLVVVATRDLAVGTVLQKSMVTVRAVAEDTPLPEGTLRFEDPAQVVERVVYRRILEGEVILRTRLDGDDVQLSFPAPPRPVTLEAQQAEPEVDVATLSFRSPVVVLRGANRTTEWPGEEPGPPRPAAPARREGISLDDMIAHIKSVEDHAPPPDDGSSLAGER